MLGPVNEENPASMEGAEFRRQLTEVREAMLRLHKALIESERTSYEQTFGKVKSPYQLLKLLTEDPWFAWLRPVSSLIAAMDTALDAKVPLTGAVADELISRARKLLVPAKEGEGFSQHYDEAMQRDPDVVLAHGVVAKLIRTRSGETPP